MYKFNCGVPPKHCTGTTTSMPARQRGVGHDKVHNSSEEAFRCMARYLVNIEGYEQVGNREFSKGGGPIRILTKKSRYGGKLRQGKKEPGQPRGRRFNTSYRSGVHIGNY